MGFVMNPITIANIIINFAPLMVCIVNYLCFCNYLEYFLNFIYLEGQISTKLIFALFLAILAIFFVIDHN